MSRVKKRILTAAVVIGVILLAASEVFLFPRVFGSEQTKALYRMSDILQSHVHYKERNLGDFVWKYTGSGSVDIEDGKQTYSLYVKTGDDFSAVSADIPAIMDEITQYIADAPALGGEDTEIVLCIENWASWIVRIFPQQSRIAIGLNDDIHVTEALSGCKEFSEIHVGGYRGYSIQLGEGFSGEYFSDFTRLERLEFGSLYPSEEVRLCEALSGLSNVGIFINREPVETA